MNWKTKNKELLNKASQKAKEMSMSLGTMVISASVNTVKDVRFNVATKGSAICVGLTPNGKEVFEMYYKGNEKNLTLHEKEFITM